MWTLIFKEEEREQLSLYGVVDENIQENTWFQLDRAGWTHSSLGQSNGFEIETCELHSINTHLYALYVGRPGTKCMHLLYVGRPGTKFMHLLYVGCPAP